MSDNGNGSAKARGHALTVRYPSAGSQARDERIGAVQTQAAIDAAGGPASLATRASVLAHGLASMGRAPGPNPSRALCLRGPSRSVDQRDARRAQARRASPQAAQAGI